MAGMLAAFTEARAKRAAAQGERPRQLAHYRERWALAEEMIVHAARR
jgi:hypothetical protein